ncbi:MAG: DUF2079 domain-containing protein [Chthoniobacter sp.]|nr:DUF2079 domain-containing protein [Chthoniobacter sp.]
MPTDTAKTPRAIVWGAGLFAGLVFLVSWWQWWTFQYGTFDLAFYVQALWLALRGKWTVSLLNVPLMGNHAEPIVFLITPLFAIFPHPMTFVAVQTLAFATMPFTAWRIARRLEIERPAAICLALATILTPATLSIGIYEFHPEALAAPLLLLLIEARLAERHGRFWLWFVAVLSVKENMALLMVAFCAVWAVLDRKRGRAWLLRWNVAPLGVAGIWLVGCGFISRWLNAGNVDYLQLYGHLGKSGGDIVVKFFTEPGRAWQALHVALAQGNLLPALLVPFLLLPLLRPRWLLIAGPLLAQHLLSWRYSEWSLGAHYPAPFLPLFWIAAAEALARRPGQKAVAAALLAMCVLAHFRWGPAQELAREIPHLATILERREWKAQMLRDVPETASVTAAVPYLSHLATREQLISLHHILKGLKTLSTATYTPPPAGEVVIIDYADTFTFSTVAGYYHPRMQTNAESEVPSSDRLLHEYLRPHAWHAHSRNELTVLTRGTASAMPPAGATPIVFDETTTLTALQIVRDEPGVLQFRLGWEFTGERTRFPWMMLVLSDGEHLYPFVKGACAPQAGAGAAGEDWTFFLPPWMRPHHYAVFAVFYDASEAAGKKRLPPDDSTFVLRRLDLGGREMRSETEAR